MLLEQYPLKRADVSRLKYIRFREQDLNLKTENIEIKDYEKHLKITKASYYLLDNNLKEEQKSS